MVLIKKTRDFDKIIQIRMKIFNDELGISEDEIFDSDDEHLEQFLIVYKNVILGTFRLRSILNSHKIERMGILAQYRSKGHGKSVLKELKFYSKTHGMSKIVLESIYGVRGFYEKSGFKAIGPLYTKAGISHVKMYFDLS